MQNDTQQQHRYRFNFPCSAQNLFTVFSTFKNIRWGPAATQMLWTCCYGSLLRPHLWLKGFFVCWQNHPQLLSPVLQRQAIDDRAPCDKLPARQQYWRTTEKLSALQRLIWTEKLKYPILTEAMSVVLFIDCFEVQLMLVEPSGCIEPNVQQTHKWVHLSHEVFRCESPLNSIAWVRTLSSLKYAYHVCFDPIWNITPSPAWTCEILQATVLCISLTCIILIFFVCLFVCEVLNELITANYPF